MTTLQIEIEDAHPVEATCDATHLSVALRDGRALQAPLWWYPRLQKASPRERSHVELMPMGIHWPDIDEDISIASILRGEKAPGARAPRQTKRHPVGIQQPTALKDETRTRESISRAMKFSARGASSLTEEQVKQLADAVLREELGSSGYESVSVRFDDDNDGDPAIYLDAHLLPNSPLVDAKIFVEALHKLRSELINNGELRFPYLYTRHPDDEFAYDNDIAPGVRHDAAAE
jgi:hypothetical protein